MLYKHKFSANITIEDIGKIALGCFSASSKIYLSRFENISLLDDMHYDYILASRSDAFLHEKYSEFILNISKYINKDGFYISDGILSSYSYGIFYNNLDEIFSQVGEERVYFVISAKNSTSLPMRDISGIILLGQNADIKKTYSFISQDKLIAAHQILNCEPFIKQCIWTDLFYWATNKEIDLEEYKFGAINNLLYKYIELKRANIHISLEFDNEEMFIKS